MDQTLKLKPEEEFLLCCSRTCLDEEIKEKIKYLIESGIDWDYLIQIASLHRLIPLLYWHLNSLDLETKPPIMEMLKTSFEMNTNKNLLFLGELFKIIRVFKANNLDIIPFKGPILAFLAYDNLAFRQFDDLDFFVHQKDVADAKKIISSLGYEPQLQLDVNKEEFYIKTQREFKFSNPKNNVHLELHWRLIGLNFFFKDDIFRKPDKNIVKIQNNEILTLTHELTFLLLCVHAAGHRWERLNWLCDISEMAKHHELNWEKLIFNSEKLGVKRILLVNLLLAKSLLNLNLPEQIENQISRDNNLESLSFHIQKAIFSPEGESKISKALLRLSIRENIGDKFKDFIRIVFLPTHKEWSSLNLPNYLLMFYYLYRPLKVLKDY